MIGGFLDSQKNPLNPIKSQILYALSEGVIYTPRIFRGVNHFNI